MGIGLDELERQYQLHWKMLEDAREAFIGCSADIVRYMIYNFEENPDDYQSSDFLERQGYIWVSEDVIDGLTNRFDDYFDEHYI